MALTKSDYLQLKRPKAKRTKRTIFLKALFTVVASVLIYGVIWFFVYLMFWLIYIVGSVDKDGGGLYSILEYVFDAGYLIIPTLWILLSLWAGFMIFRTNAGSAAFRCPNCNEVLDGARNCRSCDYKFSEHEWVLSERDNQKKSGGNSG